MFNTRIRGKKAEDVACNFLLNNGLELLERNYSCRYGEIDLIMRDSDVLVFIEVRYRKHAAFGTAAESIDANKRRKIIFTADYYLQRNKPNCSTRFDVVTLDAERSPEWITDAFTSD